MEFRRLSRRTIAVGLAGGVAHAALALWLGAVVRGRPFRETIAPETPTGAAVVSVTALGLVLLGSVALVSYVHSGLVAPPAGLVVLFTWAFYSSWNYFEDVRNTGATSISLHADSLFGFLWFVPLAIVLCLGAVEYGVRRRFGGDRASTPFSETR